MTIELDSLHSWLVHFAACMYAGAAEGIEMWCGKWKDKINSLIYITVIHTVITEFTLN